MCFAVSYVDDCRDEDGKATHLIGETDGYLAVYRRQRSHLSPSSRHCHWTITVNPGRRINITWRVFPTPVRYIPPGVSTPLDAGRRTGSDGSPCSLKLSFVESERQPVHWACRGQDTVSMDRAAQVATYSIIFTIYATLLTCKPCAQSWTWVTCF